MTRPISRVPMFLHRQFDAEIIVFEQGFVTLRPEFFARSCAAGRPILERPSGQPRALLQCRQRDTPNGLLLLHEYSRVASYSPVNRIRSGSERRAGNDTDFRPLPISHQIPSCRTALANNS
jgi:hypothetical protein